MLPVIVTPKIGKPPVIPYGNKKWTSNNNMGLLGLAGGLAQGAISGITGLIANRQQKKLQQKEHEHQLKVLQQEQDFNHKLAQYQHQQNLEMWELQNQYNSPKAQMQRYQDAGLNPNLLYGNISSGNSSSIPQYHEAGSDYSGLKRVNMHVNNWDFVNDILSKVFAYEDHQNTQAIKTAQARNLDARTKTEGINFLIKQLDKEIKGLEKEWRGADAQRKKDIHQEWLDNKQRRSSLLDHQIAQAKWNARLTENKAFGITENPNSWVGIINNAANSWIRENGGKGSYSQELGRFLKNVIDYTASKLPFTPNWNNIFNGKPIW